MEQERRLHLQNTQITWSDNEKDKLSTYSFYFVDGMLGDLTKDLYKPLEGYLKKQLPTLSLEILRPSSFNGIEENARWLNFQLNKENDKPKVILAHSRGAVELFLALLMDPTIIEKAKLHKIIFIQGAFAGSPLAEWVIDLFETGCQGAKQFSKEEACDFANFFLNSARALIPQKTLEIRAKYQKNLDAREKELLHSRVFYVRSHSSFKNTGIALKAGSAYLRKFYNGYTNDGVLLSTQQKVKGLGTDLGLLNYDHIGLLGNNKQSPLESVYFFRALLKEIDLF